VRFEEIGLDDGEGVTGFLRVPVVVFGAGAWAGSVSAGAVAGCCGDGAGQGVAWLIGVVCAVGAGQVGAEVGAGQAQDGGEGDLVGVDAVEGGVRGQVAKNVVDDQKCPDLLTDELRAAGTQYGPGSAQRLLQSQVRYFNLPSFRIQRGQGCGIDGTDLLRRALVDLLPEDSVIEAARRIRGLGVKVGIFSNSLGLEPYNPYESWKLEENYDTVLISEHYHMRKPDPEIYAIMLDLMQLPAEDCVFVDDTAHNLPPAERLGMTVILATNPAATITQLREFFG
jgi:hypothetical protein